jgi:hypothetical protein
MTEALLSHGKHSYYSRRAAQERALAERSRDPSARRIHDELARRYAALTDEVLPEMA